MNNITEEDKKKVYYKLINGRRISNIKNCPTDSGLYLLFPNFEIGNGYKWLKVGMTVDEKGLYSRIGTHYKSSLKRIIRRGGQEVFTDTETLSDKERRKLKLNEVRSRFSSILGKHLWFDFEFSKRFGFDLTKRNDRKRFLQEYCHFKVLPLPQYNWKIKEERMIKKIELKQYEDWIQDRYRFQIRYIGRVKVRG